jgi:hypothetical protein
MFRFCAADATATTSSADYRRSHRLLGFRASGDSSSAADVLGLRLLTSPTAARLMFNREYQVIGEPRRVEPLAAEPISGIRRQDPR